MDDWIEIGKIVAPQGIKGEVRVLPSSDFPERFLEPGIRWLLKPGDQQPEEIELLFGRVLDGKGLYVLTLEGVGDRAQAEQLRNSRLFVPEGDRLPLEADEFHVMDLIGLPVYIQSNQTLVGNVRDVLPAGNDLLEVELAGKTVLIPFVRAIVPVVDLEQGRIEIDPPAGLLDI